MPTHVALLRGINVGGHNKVPMADLRALMTDLGHTEVATHVASGNVVFTPADPSRGEDDLAAGIATALESEQAVTAAVMVRTAAELRSVHDTCPWPEQANADPTKVHVAFLDQPPADPSLFAAAADGHEPEELVVGERVLHLHLPDGMGRSRLAISIAKVDAGVTMTMRNWRTVTRLVELCSES